MIHQQPTEEVREQAALYTLGVLRSEEAAAFEAHLAEGCHTCEREVKAFAGVVGHLGHAVSPVRPRPGVRDRLLARLQAQAGGDAMTGDLSQAGAALAHPDWTVVRSAEGEWEASGASGLVVKRLFQDPAEQRFMALVRMEAGVYYPSHRHADTEELYMLEGDLTVEGLVLRGGDYCAAVAGTVHGVTHSDGGCTFLLLASERDEIVEESGTGAVQTGLVIVRSAEQGWRRAAAEGVTIRPLFSDPARGTMTALVQMQAGSRFPRHRHVTAEQFYMLEGDGHVAGQALQAGDYYRAAAGTVHEVTYSESGCMFLLISSHVEVSS